MKKYFLLFAIIFISSSFWNSARSDDGTEWTYDPVGLITDVDQLSDNCEWAPNMLKDMIDNSDQTNFHSNPSTDLRQTDEWIQVKLPYAMQNIKFTMSRRRDGSGDYYNNWNQLPNNVDILVSDDGTTWNKVTNVSQPNLTQSSEDDFASYVDLGGEFQYVRFVVRGTVDDNGYFNISEMQIYKAIKADAQTKLKVKLNDLKTATVSFLPGTDPGFYATDPYNALMQAFKDAEALLTGSHSDAEYTAMMETLQNAYTACVNSKNAIHDGYYYIKSAYKAFKDVQPNAIKAMYATASSTLAWGDLDMNLPKYVFHITKQADGNYAIQNLETQEYVKNAGDKLMSTGIAVSTTKTAEQGQYFIELGYGQFRICNTVNMYAYNVDGNNSGKGTSGNVCTENSGQNGESAWFLTEITDESTIAKMKEEGTKYYLAEKLQETATEAETARQKAFDYDILIKNATDGDAACQIMSNAKEPNEGSYANLIDGNTSTFFHSIYSATGPLTAHNLQIDMVTPVEKLFFKYIGRSGDYHDNPNDINVYVTNDDVLGKDVNSADGDWIPVIHLTEGFPSDVSEAKYISPIFKLSSSYRYLRLVMNNTTSAASGRVNSTTHLPFFNLSEFQVYNGTPSTSSEYNLISGMKSACDALEKLIQDSKEKVTNLAATQDDIDAIKAATNTLNDLYVNRDAMDSQMAILLDSAQKVYDNATGNNQKLILDEDQLSTNSSSAGDESSLAHLIDGDLTTIFHSHWDTAMADASTTVDSWDKLQTAWVTNNSDNIAVGTGYHNLQVKLIQPISNFNFTYTGRGDTDYHDNPNDVEIYATNDDNLGANVLASDSSKWTKITELKNGFPENIRFAQYISPNIDLTKPYKYIRFVIKGTTNQNCAGLSRQFVVPDITGITWNVSEFQMYMVLNPERIQYNYIPALKEAIDAMKTLMDADKKLERHSILTTEPIVSLRTAMNKALSLYADSTELSGLYGKYKAYAD
ncbi:MAG: discoidin domain-containing protein, partial [Bacteroidaceae bacterium]|nr:discoidin domain-containing protein [Bacteroidaceae bacterium]